MGLKKVFNKNTPTFQMEFSFRSQNSAKEFYEQYQHLMDDGQPVSLPENTTIRITEHLDDDKFPLDDITVSEGTLQIPPREDTIPISSEFGDFEIKAMITPLQEKLLVVVDVNNFFEMKLLFYLNSQILNINIRRIDVGFVKITDVHDSYYKVNAIIKHFGVLTADDTVTKDSLQTYREIERLLEKAVMIEAALGTVFDFNKTNWKEDWALVAELYAGIVEKRPFRQNNASLTTFGFTPSDENALDVIVGANLSLQSIDNITMTVMGSEITISCMMVFSNIVVEKISFDDEQRKYVLTPGNNKDNPSVFSQQFFNDELSENEAKNEFHETPNTAFEKYRNCATIDDLCNEYYH